MAVSSLPTIKFLKQPTSQAWVEQAIAHLDIILLNPRKRIISNLASRISHP